MQKKIHRLIISTLVFCVLFTNCDSRAVYDVYKPLPNYWHKDSLVQFSFASPDTINRYNLFINLRNNNAYKYNNLFLIVSLSHPNGKIITDTLEYKMAAPNGELLGTGFSDIKENKLWYKGYDGAYKFSEDGQYSIGIQQAMRVRGETGGVQNLDGIMDVGFRIEMTQ